MRDDEAPEVLAVHLGQSASCSSIGSVVDVLFVSGVVGTALLAALAVMLGGDDGRTDGPATRESPPPSHERERDADQG